MKSERSLVKNTWQPRKTIAIQTEKRKVLVPVDDIFYVESMKEYVRIHTSAKAYTTKVGITKLEEELGTGFLRVHRSFLVAIGRIHAYDATELEVGGKLIPIGRNYKDSVISSLAGKF